MHRIRLVLSEMFFERPLVQEGLPSTVFHNSKNLACLSQDLRPDISETARRGKKRIVEFVDSTTSLTEVEVEF